ncbi:hypothetical protein D3C87_1933450 [compost metagenome]
MAPARYPTKLAEAMRPASPGERPRSVIIAGRIGVYENRPNPMATAMAMAPAVAVAEILA